MKVMLNLGEDARVLSAGVYAVAPSGCVEVDDMLLPQGDLCDYLYVDGEFVYDPEDEEEPPITQEERIAALEEQNTMLTECLLELSMLVYA